MPQMPGNQRLKSALRGHKCRPAAVVQEASSEQSIQLTFLHCKHVHPKVPPESLLKV